MRNPGAAVAHIEIDAVEPARDHADAQLARFPIGDRNLVEPQHFVAAMSVNARRQHGRVPRRTFSQKATRVENSRAA